MNLGVEWWLGSVAISCRWNWGKRGWWQSEVGCRCLRVSVVGIQGVRDWERSVVSIGRVQVVCDIGEAVFEDANLPRERLHTRFISLDPGLLLAEVRRHCCHWTSGFMCDNLGTLGVELASHNCSLAGDDMFGAVVVDVRLKV